MSEENLELVVNKIEIGSLDTNIARLEEVVDERLKDYTPESYQGDADRAKKDKAELNKAKDTVASARKKIIAEVMKPYTDFEERCKALEKKIEKASRALDEIVKERKAKEDEKKRSMIELYWKTKNFDLVKLDAIFNPKWLNKTYKESDIISEIDEKIAEIKNNIESMKDDDNAENLVAYYLICLDMDKVREYRSKLELQRKEQYEKEQLKPAVVSVTTKKDLERAGYYEEDKGKKEYVINLSVTATELKDVLNALNELDIKYSYKELDF